MFVGIDTVEIIMMNILVGSHLGLLFTCFFILKANACRNEAVYEVFNKNNENSIKVIQEKFVLNFKIFHTCKFSGSNIRKKH